MHLLLELLNKKIFVRTVTYHTVGRFTAHDERFIRLEEASWVADSGRWNEALRTGELDQVEPFNLPPLIAIDSIVDLVEWEHDLPTEVR